MKLALYLPNFRNLVTVRELEDLTSLAEELDFNSVWTLDRLIVPESSDRAEMQYAFGMIDGFPKALPVSSRGQWFQGWPLIPWLAAKTSKVRIGMSICDTPYRAPGVLAAELATVDHLSNGRLNVGVGAGWMPEEFAAASASHIFPKRHKHVRETIEIMQAVPSVTNQKGDLKTPSFESVKLEFDRIGRLVPSAFQRRQLLRGGPWSSEALFAFAAQLGFTVVMPATSEEVKGRQKTFDPDAAPC